MTQAGNPSSRLIPMLDGPAVRPKDAVQSLERAVAVLTAFDAGHPSLTLTELSNRCRLPRSATRRFLHTLLELGFVEVSGRRFALTPQVLDLGYANASRFSLADVCQPHVERIARQLRASASVSVLDGPDVRYVCRVDVTTGLSVSLKTGSRLPAHLTAAGKVLIAYLSPNERDRYITSAAGRGAAYSLTDPERGRLEGELRAIESQGWAFADQELDVGVQAVAVPLRSRTGRHVGALTAATFEAHESARTLVPRFLPGLLDTAGRISLELRAGIEA